MEPYRGGLGYEGDARCSDRISSSDSAPGGAGWKAEGPSGQCVLAFWGDGGHPSNQRPSVRQPQGSVLGHNSMAPNERELFCATQQQGRNHLSLGECFSKSLEDTRGCHTVGTGGQGPFNLVSLSLSGGDVKNALLHPPASPAQSDAQAKMNISMEYPEDLEREIQHLIQDLQSRTISEVDGPTGESTRDPPSHIFPKFPGNAVALALSENTACGPRRDPDGVGEASQGITGSQCFGNGSVHLEMTLMVAGFIIGPRGSSIHSIADKTKARVTSFMKNPENGRIRVFVIEGSPTDTLNAVEIILKAVVRYKELTEGQYSGKCVDAVQTVQGVEFLYRPPPKRRVPQAATIKSLDGTRD